LIHPTAHNHNQEKEEEMIDEEEKGEPE